MTTASAQAIFATPTSSGAFFIDVYNAHTSSTAAEVQLSLAYGHSLLILPKLDLPLLLNSVKKYKSTIFKVYLGQKSWY